MALNGFHIVIEPGAENPHKHEPPPDPEPPEGFVDTTVNVFRLNPDGTKGELLRIDPAFPEGWNDPAQYRKTPGRGLAKKKGEGNMVENWKEITQKVQTLVDEGLSTYKASRAVSKEIGVHYATIYNRVRKEIQVPDPVPAAAANQEPERESQEPATEIIPVIMPLENDLTADDEEPIPYILAPDHHDVAEEIACLLDRKGQDYGTENIKKFGSYGVLVRVSDKVERLINLSRKEGQVNFESVEDSWKDIAGYAILALIELREGR